MGKSLTMLFGASREWAENGFSPTFRYPQITHSLLDDYWRQNARKLLMAERGGFEPPIQLLTV